MRFFDGSTSSAELVGSFPDDDVALVRVEDADDLVPATLGDSGDLQVGDEVVAIGNALDLTGQPTVTRGIVSAPRPRDRGRQNVSLDDLIQTDAAINPGNSGGPLVAADGTVVGINTAIIDGSQNIGFAIAIDSIKPRIDDIREGRGEITPDTAFLGVSTARAHRRRRRRARAVRLDADDEGAFVIEVVPGSAAEDAGLVAGDLIIAIDGEAVTSSEQVRDAVQEQRARRRDRDRDRPRRRARDHHRGARSDQRLVTLCDQRLVTLCDQRLVTLCDQRLIATDG